MPVIEFDGERHEFPDDFTDADIQSALAGQPAKAPPVEGAARVGGFLTRYGASGIAKGIGALPALAADSIVGVGRDIAYGGKKALSMTGAVEAPDPANYYSGSSAFPTTDAVTEGADRLGRAVTGGLIEPEGPGERTAAAALEGGASALTGSGVGAAMARATRGVGQRIGRFMAAEPVIGAAAGTAAGGASQGAYEVEGVRQALPEWAPAAIGMAAGVGAGTALSGARAFGGYVPGYGRVSTTSRAGQEAISNDIVQGVASNPAVAARNLRARDGIEADPGFVAPGYQELSTNAAQDTGLATARQYFRDAAGGQIADRAQENNAALNRAFVFEGAGEGAEAAVREQARAGSRRDLGRFGLTAQTAGLNPDPIDVTRFDRALGRRVNPRTPGTTAATNSAASELRSRLRALSQRTDTPRLNAAGEEIGVDTTFRMSPERMQSLRQDISESLKPGNPAAPPALPSAVNARRFMGEVQAHADSLIDNVVQPIAGPQGRPLTYADYMARQRGLRNEADERGFMRALLEDLGPNTNPITGAQEIRAPKLAKLFNERNLDRKIPGARSNMSIDRLSPARQSFLRDMEELGQSANFSNTAGTSSAGSSTAKNLMTEAAIAGQIRAGAAPYEKVLGAVSGIPGLGYPGKWLTTLVRRGMGDVTTDAGAGVRARLGAFETDRDAAVGMLTGRGLPERGIGISARRQGARTARYGVQSFMASQQGESRRTRRPY